MPDYALTDSETVSRISDVAPRAMSSYFIILQKASEKNEIFITRDEIVLNHQKSWTKFKNDLRALARMFIINFFDDGDSISASLIDMEVFE